MLQATQAYTTKAAYKTQNLKETPENEPVEEPSQQTEVGQAEGDFGAMMQKLLGGAGKSEVNEEELFAALIEQRLAKENPEAAAHYREQLTALSASMARADGYVPVEDAAMAALRATVAAGKLDDATAQRVNAEAFQGAQLDSNLNALYDGRGSEGDPTIATSAMEAALLSMRTLVEKFDSGEADAGVRPLDAPSNAAPAPVGEHEDGGHVGDLGSAPSGTQSLDGSGGFLWKPESEKNGNLVVLLPKELAGLISKVEIHSSLPPSESTKIASGNFSSNANGGRDHFRFDEPGSAYGSNVYVVAYREDGETVNWQIGDGGERND